MRERFEERVGRPAEVRAGGAGDRGDVGRGREVVAGDRRGDVGADGDVDEEEARPVPLTRVRAVRALAAQAHDLDPAFDPLSAAHVPWILPSVVDVHLGLGANLGDRLAALRLALDALGGEMTITAVSSVYETAPFGVAGQPPFLNCCLSAETQRDAQAVLALAKSVEARLGRVARERWGSREIDIDLLLFGDQRIASAGMVVPHPGIAERAFVLVPLAEIAGARLIPGLGMTVSDALARLPRALGDVVWIAGPPVGPDRAAR